ncbi:MAG: cbb3-type cytochrome oxidase assembly protein CcoS [Betaproteobacteria bacterium]|nr:cbb3-type cytochrome oxidase assembly protein CcoS [Betaproteobacteria bacterium]
MESLYILIPLSVVLIGGVLWVLWWSVGSGQFDDLEGPGHRILMDDDRPAAAPPPDDLR